MIISKTLDVPIYMQIVGQFRDGILSGKLHNGEKIPSVRELAAELQCSVITVSKAYEELKLQGLVVSARGTGHFVCVRDEGAIREQRLREIEVSLMNAISAGRMAGCSDAEIRGACVQLMKK